MTPLNLQSSVGRQTPILRKDRLPAALQSALEVPTVTTLPLAAWKNAWTCGRCTKFIAFANRSHCRACGASLCTACVRRATLPAYGLVSQRHVACGPCASRDYSDQWRSMVFDQPRVRRMASGVLGLLWLHPTAKRPFADFAFGDSIDFLRGAFLCSDVPPIEARGQSLVYRQREAWLRFAATSFAAAVALARHDGDLTTVRAVLLRKRVRVALVMAKLLAERPQEWLPEQCWDVARDDLRRGEDDGLLPLCVLLQQRGDWKATGDWLLGKQLLLPALFAYKVHDEGFSDSERLTALAARQATAADVVFYAAAAALVDETARNVLQLAKEAKKAQQTRWAIEILCASWDTWRESALKARGHALLVECLEAVAAPGEASDEDVLCAGYRLLCGLVAGERLQEYQTKLQAIERRRRPAAASAESPLRALRHQLALTSAELLADLLRNSFAANDVDELRSFIALQQRTYAAADRARLPAPVRANLLLPEAVLSLLQGRALDGLRTLHDAVVLSASSGLNVFVQLAAELAAKPATRIALLTEWRDQLRRCDSVAALLASPWLADVGQALDTAAAADFQFVHTLRNSPELRAARLVERAVDNVASRDGPFEAAMSSLDAAVVCAGPASRVTMLLKAARHLYRAMQLPSAHPQRAYRFACCWLGQLVVQLAAQAAERSSPVLQAHLARQILFQQLAFLHEAFALSTGRVPEGTDEWLAMAKRTLAQLLSLLAGFPVLASCQRRAFDDVVTEMVFDRLSDATLTQLETQLAGLVTVEQWSYWRLEGAWQSWLHNPHNDAVTAADAARRERSQRRAVERRMRADAAEADSVVQAAIAAEEAAELAEEAAYQRQRALQLQQNQWTFLEEERRDVVIRYLAEQQWGWEQVSRLVNCLNVPRTPDGFIDARQPLSPPGDWLFSSFDGFEIDRTTGSVRFLLTEARRSGKPALFGWQQLREILQTGAPAMVFSLDAIDAQHRPHHPFQVPHFKPDAARGTMVLSAMLHTDYLLKFLTCGLEVSCCPPFRQRHVRDGFLRRLPEHVQDDLSVIWSHSATAASDAAHRFWIDAGALPYNETRTEATLRVVYGKQTMRVKKHKLRLNAQGEHVDDEADDGAEDDVQLQFARSFSRHYDAIAGVFPEFAMLAEFTKMIAATAALMGEAYNCQQNVAHLEGQVAAITSDIEASLRSQLQGVIEFPMEGSRRVDELIDEHVRETDRLNGFRLTQQQRNEVRSRARNEYQRQAREADTQQVAALARALEVSQTAARDVLVTKNFRSIARDKAQQTVRQAVSKFEALLAALRREGLPVNGDVSETLQQSLAGGWSTSPSSTDRSCCWVPAVFRPGGEIGGGTFRVYGGVSLHAELSKQTVNPPATSQHFASPTTLGAQRAIAAPFSTAARIDNANRANADFFSRQQQVHQQLAAQREAARQAHTLSTFTTHENSRGGPPGSGTVRRYASSVDGVAGAYWTSNQFHSRAEARNGLAVLPAWSSMKYLAVSSIPPNAHVISGPAAPQGPYSGGATQHVVPNVWDQRRMAETARVYKHEWTPRFFETWNRVK